MDWHGYHCQQSTTKFLRSMRGQTVPLQAEGKGEEGKQPRRLSSLCTGDFEKSFGESRLPFNPSPTTGHCCQNLPTGRLTEAPRLNFFVCVAVYISGRGESKSSEPEAWCSLPQCSLGRRLTNPGFVGAGRGACIKVVVLVDAQCRLSYARE